MAAPRQTRAARPPAVASTPGLHRWETQTIRPGCPVCGAEVMTRVRCWPSGVLRSLEFLCSRDRAHRQ